MLLCILINLSEIKGTQQAVLMVVILVKIVQAIVQVIVSLTEVCGKV